MLYGTDPEFFSVVFKNDKPYVISPALLEFDGQIKPVINGRKHPIYIDNKDFSWMMDGVAWELTIKKPAKSVSEVDTILNNSIETLEELISKLSWEGQKLSFYRKPIVNIEPEIYLDKLNNEKIYQGFIFGCDPDEDAGEEEYVCKTIDVATHLFRYGGGHIHFSGLDSMYHNPRTSIRLLAITVGNFVISNSPYLNLEKQRGETYGRPLRFRPQHYKNGAVGVEYRTPSNTWTEFPLSIKEELFFFAEKAGEFLFDQENANKIISQFLPPTISAINSADAVLAKSILDEIRKEF